MSEKQPRQNTGNHPDPLADLYDAARALQWLADNRNCELSHDYGDEDEDPTWRVHRVNGGRNDREWTLIGEGPTPLSALIAAAQAE